MTMAYINFEYYVFILILAGFHPAQCQPNVLNTEPSAAATEGRMFITYSVNMPVQNDSSKKKKYQ